jgi:hypothetical protein
MKLSVRITTMFFFLLIAAFTMTAYGGSGGDVLITAPTATPPGSIYTTATDFTISGAYYFSDAAPSGLPPGACPGAPHPAVYPCDNYYGYVACGALVTEIDGVEKYYIKNLGNEWGGPYPFSAPVSINGIAPGIHTLTVTMYDVVGVICYPAPGEQTLPYRTNDIFDRASLNFKICDRIAEPCCGTQDKCCLYGGSDGSAGGY